MRIVLIVVGLLAMLFPTIVAAQQFASPSGTWEIDSKDSQYEVTICGDAGELCGKLVWLGNGADTPENMPYLNTLLIDHAVPTSSNQWAGELHLFGQSAAGTITQYSDRRMEITGCLFGVFCRSYHLMRID